MHDDGMPGADPRDSLGPFGSLMAQIRACKDCKTCPSLTSRSYYFEPNPATAHLWQASGLYRADIDRRVAFVCESPGRQFSTVNRTDPLRCWAPTVQDEKFRKVRLTYGFDGCYITNSVKCGPRSQQRHTPTELASCRAFLVRELQLLRPLVVVGVGGNAYVTLQDDVIPLLHPAPRLFRITHYAYHGDPWPRWEREFPELPRMLSRLEPRSQW